jgi:hypothetical protein
MNELLKERFFSLLSEPSQEVTNEEIPNAYGCFMKRVEAVSQSEKDCSEIYRILNITRIELVFLQSLHRYEQGKKCLEICLSSKSNSIS